MNILSKIAVTGLFLGTFAFADHHMGKSHKDTYDLPNLKMEKTDLSFDEIAGYEDYKIVASHFRKDKSEIRYILANNVAFDALKDGKNKMPQGSKIVKIGWDVKDIATFPSALEANNIQRVEYMIRDKDKHKESDGWGYARFVKNNGKYQAWGGDIQTCVSCHGIEAKNDALFTRYQKVF